MKRIFLLTGLVFAMALFAVQAEGPDDTYVRIYDLIQQGDNLSDTQQSKAALIKYRDALNELKKLRDTYPAWNANVVTFRINYLVAKVAPLEKQFPDAPVASGTTNGAVSPTPSALPPADTASQAALAEAQNQIRQLLEQIRQSQADNMRLDAKLREALSVQPAAVDPQELTKAEAQLRKVQKENELLQVTLEQERTKTAKLVAPTKLESVQKDLADANQKLDKQKTAAAKTILEKEALEKQLKAEQAKSAKMADPDALEKARKALAESNHKLEIQIGEMAKATQEKDNLQKQLKAQKSSKKADKNGDSALRQENADLRRQLESLKIASEKPTPSSATSPALAKAQSDLAALKSQYESLSAEKEILQARVKFIESKPVAPVPANASDAEKQLASVRLSAQSSEAKVAALQKEKEILEKARADAENRLSDTSSKMEKQHNQDLEKMRQVERDLVKARVDNQAAEDKTAAAIKDKNALEARIAALISEKERAESEFGRDAKQLKVIQKERDALQDKLNDANKELTKLKNKSQSGRVEDLNDQLSAMRARLSVFEAKAVPYTPEEMALFKKPETRLPIEKETASKKRGKELPAATGKLVAEAQSEAAAGHLDQAEKKFNEVLKQDQTHVASLVNLAGVNFEQNKLTEASNILNQALAIDKGDAGALYLQGVMFFQAGNLDQAIDSLGRSAKSNPNNPDTQNYLGYVLSKKGMRAPAEAALRRAIQLRPSFGLAHMNLAVVYANQKPPFMELSRWHYEKALSSGQPRDPELEKILNAVGEK